MELSIFTDGGALNNPGEGAIGVVFFYKGKPIYKISHTIGYSTNNRAEYTAVIVALQILKLLLQKNVVKKDLKVKLFSDSRLMVNQLNGNFKIKDKNIKRLVKMIKEIEQELPFRVIYVNIPREKNRVADSLVKKAFKRDNN